MRARKKKPIIKLGYRPPGLDPAPPTSFHVLAGYCCTVFCLVALLVGFIFLILAAGILAGFWTLDLLVAIASPCAAGVCWLMAWVFFRMSRQLLGEPQRAESVCESVASVGDPLTNPDSPL